ncbi:MAG: winged helix-turn-helix domain-containing protein [Nannocystaceae bacterium]|nr:helix-turn-helix domain-containing protein [bacterium]
MPMSADPVGLARACDEAAAGRFAQRVVVPADAAPQLRVLAELLACQRWCAGVGERPATLDPDLVTAPRGAELLVHHVEAATLQLDAASVSRLRTLARGVHVAGARDQTWLALARCLLDLASGDATDPAALVALERSGRENKEAGQVLRAATLRALATEAAGRSNDAVEDARRAFRMARTERRPQAEYWAGWTLARQRRLTGRPYLASRILGAQRQYAPAPWHGWIGLERTLAEGTAMQGESGDGPLRAALEHARAGDHPGFTRAADALMSTLEAFAPLRNDVADLLACLGQADSPPREVVAQWRTAERPFDPPPCGLSAVALCPLALVVAKPSSKGSRVLGLAEPLLPHSVSRLLLTDKPGRTESLLAALALAGPDGLDEQGLFAAVYGFTYNATLHRGAWDVALHRARAACKGLATLFRAEGHVRLEATTPFVVPDPRCQRAHEDRVLQRMATSDGASARDLAAGLGLSLRTVQDVLRDLVDTGACQQHRDGRRRVYSVEDTTFQEPTSRIEAHA